ncbi:MAG: hypothetical protein KF746_23220 [Chitinophagaceae bacterium]|nr:hypothetical protein [Chitinophagaceae bacterium]
MTTKKKQQALVVTCITAVLAISCGKEIPETERCRTCTARLGGDIIEQMEACSAEAESSFERSHPYATVTCR